MMADDCSGILMTLVSLSMAGKEQSPVSRAGGLGSRGDGSLTCISIQAVTWADIEDEDEDED